MPESVVREELQELEIYVQAVMHLSSGRRDQDQTKEGTSPPLHCIRGARDRGV